jgi:uncharacterized protein YndB with AHSA1/START domain
MAPINEIVFERTYDAPLARVWQAWTEPALIRQWWGPDNVTIPECEVDLRVGGTIYIVMEAGEGMGPYKGTRWPMRGTFTVVEPKTRLAYAAKAWTEGQEGATEIEQTTDLSLSEANGITSIRLIAAINVAGPKAGMAVQGMEYGFNQQFDKLTKFLAK